MVRHGVRWLLVLALAAVAAQGGCTERDPFYCDRTLPCPAGLRCLLAQHECVPIEPDLGCTASGEAPEDCGNGVDDNGDCLVDCEDPKCGGSPQCPAVLGYGIMTNNANCPVGSTSPFPAVMSAVAPGTCSGCKCNPVCSADLRAYPTMNDCAGVPQETLKLTGPPNQCRRLTSAIASTTAYVVDAPKGDCVADGTSARPDLTVTRAMLCTPSSVKRDCTELTCVGRQPISGNLCLLFDGTVDCPARYPRLSRWFRSIGADTRTCRCCGTPSPANCTASTPIWGNETCTGTALQGVGTGACGTVMSATTTRSVQFQANPSFTCQQIGATMGAPPEGQGPLTMCCLQ